VPGCPVKADQRLFFAHRLYLDNAAVSAYKVERCSLVP
jgi:hypothetical protein